ncbi:hypothetical protein BDV96DRAFT_668326 [Lophiotrema nucula]|uniref:Uncharacterized protein n=1 Tax=Lophiotrema nucula TaxID=690887 RepID=A0A6A5ZQ53_9PLEO|nr:hypothetical protein BDV96DRAFT_668326 [Lophiotrema nucula]
MFEPSTIAASCAALGNTINQIILDARSFARKTRDSRHDMNAINAELLAIKTSLEIVHDDFTSYNTSTPSPFLVPISSIIVYCGNTIDDVHKLMLMLSANQLQAESWRATKHDEVDSARHRLEVLRLALDLALDHISIFPISPPFPDVVNTPSTREQGTQEVFELLQRIDNEHSNIKRRSTDHTELLLKWLKELRQCTEATYESLVAEGGAPKRSDSAEPEAGYLSRRNTPLSGQTSATESSGAGIGAWLESISAHTVQRSAERAELITITRTKKSATAEPRTFYSESSTSGSYSTAKSWYSKTRSRTGGPIAILRGKKSKRHASRHTSTATSSDASAAPTVPRLPIRSLDPDKMPIAKSRRLALTEDQRVALDWDLRHISSIASATSVERVLREGADPNVEDPHFGRLYVRAAYHLPLETVKLLVEYGADITRTDIGPYCSALHAAVLGQKLDTVQHLVGLGANIETTNVTGETPLHLAVKTAGAYPIARFLLEAGADVDAACEGGTPLQVALSSSRLDSRERSMLVELLLAHGAEELLPPRPTFTETNIPSLDGKVLIVTGGNAGIGLELVKMLYGRCGCTVCIASRSPTRIAAAIETIKSSVKTPEATPSHLKSLDADFNDLTTIFKAASTFSNQETRLDVLWNNAGIAQAPAGSTTVQGYEAHMGANCLGPHLFTKLLLPLLLKTANTAPSSSAWDPVSLLGKLLMSSFIYDARMGAYTELWAGLSEEVTTQDGGKFGVPWGGRWHPNPRNDILASLKAKEEGGTGVAAEFWDWCEEQTKPFAS